MVRGLLIAASLIPLAGGCALGPGTNFSQQDVRRIHPGMSKSELRSVMGPPEQVVEGSRGRDTWTWEDLDAAFTFRSKRCSVERADGKVAGIPVVDDQIEQLYHLYFSQPNINWINLPWVCLDRFAYALAPRQGIAEEKWVAMNSPPTSQPSARVVRAESK